MSGWTDEELIAKARAAKLPRHMYDTPSAREAIARLLFAEVAVPEALTPWQPIDTAPKDGSEVLLRVELRAGIPGKMLVGHYMQGGHCIEDHPPIDRGWYFWNGCMFDREAKPTHWMPLPSTLSPLAMPTEKP